MFSRRFQRRHPHLAAVALLAVLVLWPYLFAALKAAVLASIVASGAWYLLKSFRAQEGPVSAPSSDTGIPARETQSEAEPARAPAAKAEVSEISEQAPSSKVRKLPAPQQARRRRWDGPPPLERYPDWMVGMRKSK